MQKSYPGLWLLNVQYVADTSLNSFPCVFLNGLHFTYITKVFAIMTFHAYILLGHSGL